MGVVDHCAYEESLREVYGSVCGNFTRAEPRRRAWTYLTQLVVNPCEVPGRRRHLASYEREQRADGAQRLLTSAQWDEHKVRTEVLDLATARVGRTGGAFYLTEVTFPKKGHQAAGVARQFSMESRRLENCQLALVLLYRSSGGAVLLVDAELYLPRAWSLDADRRRRAGVPPSVVYRSKSRIAVSMVRRGLAAGLAPDVVLATLMCREKPLLQTALRASGLPHFLPLTADELARMRHVAEPARMGFSEGFAAVGEGEQRRSGWAFHYANGRGVLSAPVIAALSGQAQAMDRRWAGVREDVRLDRYEVRSWRGWHRHLTLAMIAQAAVELSRRPATATPATPDPTPTTTLEGRWAV
jgi:SRSO17 transposase